MNIGTIIYTWIYGRKVGSDEFNNRYYCNSNDFNDLNSKRWVIFSGEIEASSVPSHWHAWLHKSINVPPINYKKKYDWQKKHQANMTGTPNAYYPSSHPLSKKRKIKVSKDYEVWKP
tara:strand:- start:1262 stop:1612 length:351 start_codon:yes stop_codon:yes gene_type:complete